MCTVCTDERTAESCSDEKTDRKLARQQARKLGIKGLIWDALELPCGHGQSALSDDGRLYVEYSDGGWLVYWKNDPNGERCKVFQQRGTHIDPCWLSQDWVNCLQQLARVKKNRANFKALG